MSTWLSIILLILIIPFGLIGIKGPPYLRTLKGARQDAFELLDLNPGQKIIDLGCGDGQILIEAAQQGLVAVGYELNPLVYLIAKFRTRRYSNIQVYLKDFWQQDIDPDTSGMFVFLQDRFMKQLEDKLNSQAPKGLKLASFTFVLPNRRPVTKKGIVSLYKFWGLIFKLNIHFYKHKHYNA